MQEKITLLAKRKNIQTIFDYCLDQKITFSVATRGIADDEYEIELALNGIKQAVALGMFTKEHKFDVSGLGEMAKIKATTITHKKSETKDISLGNLANTSDFKEEQNAAILNF